MEGDILMAENAADTEAGGNVIVTGKWEWEMIYHWVSSPTPIVKFWDTVTP